MTALSLGLTPKQASLVAFLAAFVTIIGAAALAFWFRRRNRRAA